jgi:hypothetical protein
LPTVEGALEFFENNETVIMNKSWMLSDPSFDEEDEQNNS